MLSLPIRRPTLLQFDELAHSHTAFSSGSSPMIGVSKVGGSDLAAYKYFVPLPVAAKIPFLYTYFYGLSSSTPADVPVTSRRYLSGLDWFSAAVSLVRMVDETCKASDGFSITNMAVSHVPWARIGNCPLRVFANEFASLGDLISHYVRPYNSRQECFPITVFGKDHDRLWIKSWIHDNPNHVALAGIEFLSSVLLYGSPDTEEICHLFGNDRRSPAPMKEWADILRRAKIRLDNIDAEGYKTAPLPTIDTSRTGLSPASGKTRSSVIWPSHSYVPTYTRAMLVLEKEIAPFLGKSQAVPFNTLTEEFRFGLDDEDGYIFSD